MLTEADLVSAYGGKLIAISKRPISREEVRELKRKIRVDRRRK
jgi:hypothetical protein